MNRQLMRIHFNGVGFYYTNENGQQLCKMYRTLWRLKKYAKLWAV